MDKVWLITQYTIVWDRIEGERIFRRVFETSESAEQAALTAFFSQMNDVLEDVGLAERPVEFHWTEDWTSDEGVWFLGSVLAPDSGFPVVRPDSQLVSVSFEYLVTKVPIE